MGSRRSVEWDVQVQTMSTMCVTRDGRVVGCNASQFTHMRHPCRACCRHRAATRQQVLRSACVATCRLIQHSAEFESAEAAWLNKEEVCEAPSDSLAPKMCYRTARNLAPSHGTNHTYELTIINARCTGNCKMTYSIDATPYVHSLGPTHGASGETVHIRGTGFSNVTEDNVVRVGQAAASVHQANYTDLVVSLAPNYAAGPSRGCHPPSPPPPSPPPPSPPPAPPPSPPPPLALRLQRGTPFD